MNRGQQQPKDPRADEAEHLFSEGSVAQAYGLFLQLAKAYPGNEHYRLRLADTCLKIGRKDDALKIFKHLAAGLVEQGKVAQAITVSKRVLEIDPNDREIQNNLQTLYAQAVDEPTDHWKKTQAQARARVKAAARSSLDVPGDGLDLAGPRDRVTLSVDEMMGGRPDRALQSGDDEDLLLADPGDLSDRSVSGADGFMNVSFSQGNPDLSLAAVAEPNSMPRIPLFSDLPPAAFEQVVDRFKRGSYPRKTVIVRQGDSGDSLFIVAVGEVRVVREFKGTEHELAILKPGDFFGEFPYFSKTAREASVISDGIVEVLELTRTDLQEIVMRHPRVEKALFNLYKERVLQNRLAESPLFASLSPADRAHVAGLFELKSFDAGVFIFKEGDPPDDLYVIQSGKVEVVKKGVEKPLAVLGPGDFFGEYAVITNSPRTAGVKAVERCQLVVLSREALRQLLQGRPAIIEVLKKVAKERMTANMAKNS